MCMHYDPSASLLSNPNRISNTCTFFYINIERSVWEQFIVTVVIIYQIGLG